jgi:hypothetical protein
LFLDFFCVAKFPNSFWPPQVVKLKVMTKDSQGKAVYKVITLRAQSKISLPSLAKAPTTTPDNQESIS